MSHPRTRERIVEDQVAVWSIVSRIQGAPRTDWKPVVTISRAAGVSGDELGRLLARRTGFTLWDRDLVQAVATAAGGDVRIMESLDERRRRAIDDAVRGFLRGIDHTNVQYFRALARVVRTIGEGGRAIVIGRGANFLVAPGQALRIRVTAPVEWRVERLAEVRGTSAREEARRLDAERADFARYFFHREIDDPDEYDLVINARWFSVEAMADIVLAAYEHRFPAQVPVGPGRAVG